MSGTDEELLQEAMVGTDEELFNNAIAEAPIPEPEPIADEQPEPESNDGQPRNDDGTFKAKEAPAQPDPQAKDTPDAEDERTGHIPAFRLKQEAEARRQAERKAGEAEENARALKDRLDNLERQLAQRTAPAEQPQQEDEPDPILDPQGFRKHIETKFEQRLRQERGENSMRYARRTHGDAFDKAYSEATQAIQRGDQALRARVFGSPDPGEELIAWHKEETTRREVGNDPNAFFDRRLEAYLADPSNQAKLIERIRGGTKPAPAATARPAVELPPSLSGATRDSGSRASDADDNDVSDEALFRNALR